MSAHNVIYDPINDPGQYEVGLADQRETLSTRALEFLPFLDCVMVYCCEKDAS